MRFAFKVEIDTKNDQLTRDSTDDEIAQLVIDLLDDSLQAVPWIIEINVDEFDTKETK